MGIGAKAKKYYDKAEGKVDGFFVRHKGTVLILTAVAIALVVFGWSFIKSLFS
ncbi:hypothetical protein C8R31_101677 [Nitrosospira sp. Nsp2]|uniref:hypothetical protein n=1 Tax=Nitrosospira sp. Nsp2 TaxID=136548 RepID=UPI000D4200C7|nr:hypothetical protein [Nitrosospira sp. Nsp2]PTR17513.1 hypothetical protein C8R31_101677 [Nitrosospira sp. Nsp2]